MKYKFADIFSGGGGMSLGLINAGFVDTLAADFWDVAKLNYTSYYKFNNAQFLQLDLYQEDDKKRLVEELLSMKIDLLAGGPPCQGFSTLGKRGEKDTRNQLVETYLRLATTIKPKMIIMENVPAIQSMKHKSGIKYPDYAKEFLGENGYYAETIFLDGSQVGLAQTRKRLFLIGINKDYVKCMDNFAEILNASISKLAPSNNYATIREVIYDLPRLEDNEGEDVMIVDGKTIYNHKVFKYQKATLARIKAVPYGGGLQDIPDSLLSNHLVKMKSGGYGSGGFVKNLYGRLEWDKPSGTIVAGIKKITSGRFFHPENDRLLTVREAARLQSFPDDYRVYGSMVDQYTIIGNAVPPKFSELIGKVLISIYEDYKRS
ncbi:MAG: DNA cytosine methyltransferase [Staphylococcus equorum]|nr:DNA cytosine methyltransferase [Staphylococcus equorum]